MLDGGQEFHQGGRSQFREPQAIGEEIIGRKVGGNRNAADDDGAHGLIGFSDLHGHNAAERKADQYKGLAAVDLASQASGVGGEGLFLAGWDPMDVVGLKSLRQADVCEKAIVCADTGNKIRFHAEG